MSHPAAAYHKRRRAEVDEKILKSARRLILSKTNPLDVTIEAVAEDSGVAKTTIYRRFKNRQTLVATVLLGEDFEERAKKITDAISNTMVEQFGGLHEVDKDFDDFLSTMIVAHGTITIALMALTICKLDI